MKFVLSLTIISCWILALNANTDSHCPAGYNPEKGNGAKGDLCRNPDTKAWTCPNGCDKVSRMPYCKLHDSMYTCRLSKLKIDLDSTSVDDETNAYSGYSVLLA